jgi:hypothetical protein
MNRADFARATKEASSRLIEAYPKIAGLPRDARGLPLPANLARDAQTGRPIFAGADLNKEIDLLCEGRCAVTGTKLDKDDVWFVSTPDLALSPFGMILDAPVCGEAKEFSLQVCPYFSIPTYQELSLAQKDAITKNHGFDPVATSAQPDRFAAVRVRGFNTTPTKNGMRYRPSRTFTRVEFWKGGLLERAFEGDAIKPLLEEHHARAKTMVPGVWPEWAHQSVDGTLDGLWPWDVPGAREFLLKMTREAMSAR